MKGPKNDRSLSNRGIVEFPNEAAAQRFLDHVGKNSTAKLSTGAEIKFKKDKTKINQSRDWAIHKAEELIKNDPNARGKEVKVDFRLREVKVDSVLAFNQAETDLRGSFRTPYNHLKLP